MLHTNLRSSRRSPAVPQVPTCPLISWPVLPRNSSARTSGVAQAAQTQAEGRAGEAGATRGTAGAPHTGRAAGTGLQGLPRAAHHGRSARILRDIDIIHLQTPASAGLRDPSGAPSTPPHPGPGRSSPPRQASRA